MSLKKLSYISNSLYLNHNFKIMLTFVNSFLSRLSVKNSRLCETPFSLL